MILPEILEGLSKDELWSIIASNYLSIDDTIGLWAKAKEMDSINNLTLFLVMVATIGVFAMMAKAIDDITKARAL